MARQLGRAYRRYEGTLLRRCLWTDERIRTGLADFARSTTVAGPATAAFVHAGRAQLYRAAILHGGIPHWRRKLGL